MTSWIKTSLIIAFVTLMDASAGAQQPGGKHMVFPLSRPGQPVTLEVKLQYGSITVLGYEGKEVIIDANSDVKYPLEKDAAGHLKPTAKGHRLDFSADAGDNAVTVTGSLDNLINLTIHLPKGLAVLHLKTINQGDIVVKNISGSIEASNTNGSILLEHISGSLVANTTNGDVRAVFDKVDPAAPMAVTVLDGDIDLSLPQSFKASLNMTTDVGSMYTGFTVAGADKPPVRDQKTGMFRFPGQQSVTGKIGGGGPELFLKVLDGNIFLRRPINH
jgi:hypothetical protein